MHSKFLLLALILERGTVRTSDGGDIAGVFLIHTTLGVLGFQRYSHKPRVEPSGPTAPHVYDFLIIHFSPKDEFETWFCSSISSWPQIHQSPAPASPLLGLQVCISMSVTESKLLGIL